MLHAAERVGSDVAVATSSEGASGWFKLRDVDRALVGSMRIGHEQDRGSMREESVR